MHTLYARFNTGLLIFIALTGIVLVTMLATRAYGGPLDPPGALAPTMKTLQQVEPRTPIDHVPYTVSAAGSYFLTQNLSGASGIGVGADSVTIDLNGFTLSGPGTASGTGIGISGAQRGVVIKNGTIRDWFVGVDAHLAYRSVLTDLIVTTNSNDGIDIGSGGTVNRVMSYSNGQFGLYVWQVSDAWGTSIENSNFSRNVLRGVSLSANDVRFRGNIVHSNQAGGIRVDLSEGFNEIIDNSIIGNTGYGIEMDTGSTGNVVAGNTLVANTLGSLRDSGTGNHVGVFVGDASLTGGNQYSNIVY